jgi:uncharacterized protein YndB with AHSA1/START domain
MTNKTVFTKDLVNKKLYVTRAFSASVEKVWAAWTESSLLDKWWAPKPWQAQTKSFNFTEGGLWLYCMAGPEGEKHWSRVEFKTITPLPSFSTTCVFCDEEGNTDNNAPVMHWLNKFFATDSGTRVEVELTFDDVAGLKKIIEMGFEGGFTMGLGNLDELLASL